MTFWMAVNLSAFFSFFMKLDKFSICKVWANGANDNAEVTWQGIRRVPGAGAWEPWETDGRNS